MFHVNFIIFSSFLNQLGYFQRQIANVSRSPYCGTVNLSEFAHKRRILQDTFVLVHKLAVKFCSVQRAKSLGQVEARKNVVYSRTLQDV